MAPTQPSIAIIGAGPAGLTLARLLQLACPTLKLHMYETDASPHARFYQGGTLDLHPDDGLLALRRMNLFESATPFLRYDGEELTIADRHGCALVHMVESKDVQGMEARPEIDREKLKDLLLEAVGEGNVSWGRHLKKVDAEKQTLEFSDGKVEGPFDLVVGADGAWSKVRRVLMAEGPRYSGICGIEGHVQKPSEADPVLDRMVGRGSYFAYNGGRTVMAQRMGDESIKVGLWLKRDEAWVDDLVGERIVEDDLRPKLLQEYKDWCPELRQWVAECDLTRKWKLYELPVGKQWNHREGFTLIGDAAHLATPFAGLGVNAAMKDALDLCDRIKEAVEGSISLDAAVQAYEEAMFPRARHVQQRTMENKVYGFADDAPLMFMANMMGVVGKELGWPIDRGLLYWIPITKMAYAAFWAKAMLMRTWKRLGGLFGSSA